LQSKFFFSVSIVLLIACDTANDQSKKTSGFIPQVKSYEFFIEGEIEDKADWQKIETEALISTGVINPNDPDDVQASTFCNEWFPLGKIEVWDDALASNLPLKRI